MTITPIDPLQSLYNNIRVNNQPLTAATVTETAPINNVQTTTIPTEPTASTAQNTPLIADTSSLPTLNVTPNISTIDLLTIQASQQSITPVVQQLNVYSQTEPLSLPTIPWDEASLNNTFDTEYANYQPSVNNDDEMVQIIF